MQKINISQYDVVFISYDEPNAEQNWEDLKSKVPKAKRVHGIKGFASAHRAAGEISSTSNTITIDGDNRLFKDFVNRSIEVEDDVPVDKAVINWPSKNAINGLMYGNGGIKIWPTNVLRNCSTDEFAEKGTAQEVDYSYGLTHQVTFHECYSNIYSNASPLQAWRAGFREGVKLCLKRGVRVEDLKAYWPGGRKRLSIWMTIGADVENGLWSILGARQGCYNAQFSDWDLSYLGDLSYLNHHFEEYISHYSETEILAECAKLEETIKTKFEICPPLSAAQSEWFKTTSPNPDINKVPEDKGYHWVMKPEWESK